MISEQALVNEFKTLYDAWGAAIANHEHDWFERHFSDDFLGTAQPWPTLSVNKEKMIELDKAITTMEVEWLNVTAMRVGETVLTSGVVRYLKEEFKPGATIAEGMPTGSDLSSMSNGKTILYINGWRHNGSVWQIFDHHMVGVVNL